MGVFGRMTAGNDVCTCVGSQARDIREAQEEASVKEGGLMEE